MFATKSVRNPFVSLYWNLVRYNAQEKSATKSATLSPTQIMKVSKRKKLFLPVYETSVLV